MPSSDVIVLDMTVEEAAKLIISAGLITPPRAGDGEDGAEAPAGAIEDVLRAAAAESTSSPPPPPTPAPPAIEEKPRVRPFSGRF